MIVHVLNIVLCNHVVQLIDTDIVLDCVEAAESQCVPACKLDCTAAGRYNELAISLHMLCYLLLSIIIIMNSPMDNQKNAIKD